MNFEDTIPWDIINAPVTENFFGDDTIRANIIRNGMKNNIIIHARILKELKKINPDEQLTPKSRYKARVGDKIKWIEEFLFPECMKEFKWLEDTWGERIRALKVSFKHSHYENEKKPNYLDGIKDV